MITIEEPAVAEHTWKSVHGHGDHHARGHYHRRGQYHRRTTVAGRLLHRLTHLSWGVAFAAFSLGVEAWAVRFAAERVSG